MKRASYRALWSAFANISPDATFRRASRPTFRSSSLKFWLWMMDRKTGRCGSPKNGRGRCLPFGWSPTENIAGKATGCGTVGSRALDRSLISVHQSRHRELAGMVFNGFVRVITGLPFSDTQCGFKIFRRDAARIIFEQQRVERFGFDPEILFLAKRHGLRPSEVPVRWAHDAATKVQVLRDSVMMFCDLLVIRWNWLLGRYPKKNGGAR